MGRKLDEDDVIRVMCQRIVGVSEDRARIIASHIPTAEPSASDCWSNDNKTTNDSIVTKSSRYSTDRTTDGLISRQDAIKEAYPVSIDGEVFDVVQVETLMGLPSAQPEQQWIPCEEALPEEDDCIVQCSDDVLITVVNTMDEETIIDYGRTTDGKWYSETADCFIPHGWKPIAWMPLPEPWKGENDG